MRCYNHLKNKNERERKKTHENLAVARRHTGVSLMPMRRITLHLSQAKLKYEQF